jgi:hypothetical protein
MEITPGGPHDVPMREKCKRGAEIVNLLRWRLLFYMVVAIIYRRRKNRRAVRRCRVSVGSIRPTSAIHEKSDLDLLRPRCSRRLREHVHLAGSARCQGMRRQHGFRQLRIQKRPVERVEGQLERSHLTEQKNADLHYSPEPINKKTKGTWLFGARKAPAWSGYGGGAGQDDEDEA